MNENKKSFAITKLLPLSLGVLVILLDQITKGLVVKNIPRLTSFSDADECIIPILGKYLRFIHVRNNAVAFSMGSNLSDSARHILFAIIPVIVIIAVLVIYFRSRDLSLLQCWAISGIIGGGIGNLIDRFFRPEGVVDFIDCYFFGIFGWERWPTFNVADMGVVICGILFIATFCAQAIQERKLSKSDEENQKKKGK